MHSQENHAVNPTSKSRWALLKDGTWFAAFITLSIYALNVVEDRGQLRSDVRHLTDTLAEVRKELDAARQDSKQLTESLRVREIDLAKREVRFNDTERQLASTSQDAINYRNEAQTYKALVTADKRCLPYKEDIAHRERVLAISEIDVFGVKGERRQETLKDLERSKDAYDSCMGLKR